MAGKRTKGDKSDLSTVPKGAAKGIAPSPKNDVALCTQLYEVVQTRGVKGATLSTIEECITYVAEYMQFCRDNPYFTQEVIKGGVLAGTTVPIEKKRAATPGGFCLFIGWSIKTFNKNMERLEKLANDGDTEAETLLLGYSLIKEILTNDMDEAALAGLVDATYMAKLRGLRDLKDVTSNGKEAGTKAMQINVLSTEAVENLKKLGGI